MDTIRRLPRYAVSLPERSARAAAALLGGTIKETADHALPDAVRGSRLYQATIDRLLRIVVEGVGGVRGKWAADEIPVGELTKRKAAGNVMEFASIFAVGFSPLWVLAAAADVVGGSRAFLHELVEELKRDGVLSADADAEGYEDLLTRLETTSGTLADTVDVPPLNVTDLRRSYDRLRAQADDLPAAADLTTIWGDLRATADKEGRTPAELSAAIGGAAARAGATLGDVHLFGFYRTSLERIQREGLPRYLLRASRPYAVGAAGHFRPSRPSYTERGLDWLGERRRARAAAASGTDPASPPPAGDGQPTPAPAPASATAQAQTPPATAPANGPEPLDP
jgi:hypothetical protein